MKILYKFPTRCRPDKMFRCLENIIGMARHDNYIIQVTADIDDASMFNDGVKNRIGTYPHTKIMYGFSKNKIDAINRDMPFFADWDLLINMSDDMVFIVPGFDKIILADLATAGPDVLLHYPDQKASFAMITMAIMDRQYYTRTGYIYNPVYKSLFCDNEQMEVAKKLGRYRYIKRRLFNHNHPLHGFEKDELYLQTAAFHAEDKATFEKRKLENFS